MKTKAAIKYRYFTALKSFGILASLMIEVVIGVILVNYFVTKGTLEISSQFCRYIDVPLMLFAFYIGKQSYASTLKMFLQNGVSRQHTHLSFIALLPLNMALWTLGFLLKFIIYLSEYILGLSDKLFSVSSAYFFSTCYDSTNMGEAKFFFATVAVFIFSMSFGYMLSAISYSVKMFYKIMAIIIISIAIVAAIYITKGSKIVIMVLKVFFTGSLFFISPRYNSVAFLLAAITIMTVICLSVAHLLIRSETIREGIDKS